MKKLILFVVCIFISNYYKSQENKWKYIGNDIEDTEYYMSENTYNTAWVKEVSKKNKLLFKQ